MRRSPPIPSPYNPQLILNTDAINRISPIIATPHLDQELPPLTPNAIAPNITVFQPFIRIDYNSIKPKASSVMQSYPLTEIPSIANEILEHAASEPVLLTQEPQELQTGYVLMSAQQYQDLIKRLEELEDRVFGKLAETALESSSLVGSEVFTTELQRLAGLG